MATALDVINEWGLGDDEKQETIKTHSGLVLRLLNQSQLRYVEKSQCLRSVWTPTITSTGNIALPTDFLYEIPDRVKRNTNNTTDIFLSKIDYAVANARYFSGLYYYSIFNGSFYVWSAQAATPSVPYVRKPTIITALTTADLEIPTEFHHNLAPYIEAQWLYSKKQISYAEKLAIEKNFDLQANNDGLSFRTRNDKVPSVRGSFF